MKPMPKLARERRRRRSDVITNALSYQLDVCREAASADAMVLSDEQGTCLASAGAPEACLEVAARLPLLGRKAGDFEGVLLGGARGGWRVAMRRLQIAGAELYVALVGGRPDATPQAIDRSARGVARILAA